MIEFYLLDACERYMELSSQHMPNVNLLRGLFVYKHPGIFKIPRGTSAVLNNLAKSSNGSKAECFSRMLSVAGLYNDNKRTNAFRGAVHRAFFDDLSYLISLRLLPFGFSVAQQDNFRYSTLHDQGRNV
jgi:hypothetical protein